MTTTTAPPEASAPVEEPCLESIEAWRDSLAKVGRDLPDAVRIDQLRALEELKCAAEAAQALLTVDVDSSMRADSELAGIPADRQGRGIGAQVGLARRVSGFRGERLRGIATVVVREMPHVFAAWQQGLITERRVTALLRETAMLDLRHRQRIDRDLAGDPLRLSDMSDREAEGAVAKRLSAVDRGGLLIQG